MTNLAGSYLSVHVGKEWYGIPADVVIEVLNFVAINELPGTAPDILGLMTLRDVTMPVIDLRLRFGVDDVKYDLNTPLVALRTKQGPVTMVVDDVDDVEIVTKVADYNESVSPYVVGVAQLPDKLLLLLDIARFRVDAALANEVADTIAEAI